MNKHFSLSLIGCLLLLQACSSDNKSPPAEESNELTYSKIEELTIAGERMGSGVSNLSELSKPLSMSASNIDARLKLGKAYGLRRSKEAKHLYWVGEITNTSPTQVLCFVRFLGVNFLDTNDNILVNDSANFAYGSVWKFKNQSFSSNTCLAAGQTGYVVGVKTISTAYDSIVKIAFDNITASDKEVELHPVKVVPASYTVVKINDSIQTVDLIVKNIGKSTGLLDNTVPYILLGENNAPVYWSTISLANRSNNTIEPEKQNHLHESNLSYEGTANRVLYLPDYNLYQPVAVATLNNTTENMNDLSEGEALDLLLQQRNAREMNKVTQLEN